MKPPWERSRLVDPTVANFISDVPLLIASQSADGRTIWQSMKVIDKPMGVDTHVEELSSSLGAVMITAQMGFQGPYGQFVV